jgi:hypothetical protein
MGFYISPIIDVNEIDLSTTVPAAATTIAATVLRNTYKGPERKRTLITDIDTLIDTFGEPTDVAACYEDILSAMGYLKYGNMLYCTRNMPTSASFAGTEAPSGSESTFVPYTTDTAYILSDFDSEDPDEFADEVTVSSDTLWFIANSRGEWGNSIRLAIADYSTYNAIASGGHSDWDTYSALSSIDSSLADDKSLLIVVQSCAQNKDTSVDSNWETVEYWNVSTDPSAVDDEGANRFIESAINNSSSYIRVAMLAAQKSLAITLSTSEWQQFGGGVDDNDDDISDGNIQLDFDLYANSEQIDVNMFIDSGKSTTIKSYIASICKDTRKDCMAILDCLKADVVNNSGSEATSLRTYSLETLNINNSYAALYGNWLNVYDKWNGKYRWIPASGHVAGIYANTDYVADPWFAPAGLNRAILTNVRKLAWNPTEGERNILYKAKINPIVSFSGQGKVIWGQKTQLSKSSAFDRVNVRRLFIVLEKSISTAARYFLFDPNDEVTRAQLVNMIDPFLRDTQARRGVYEYLIVCDTTNNTTERIDRNELWADIYIKPTRAAEFIVLNFIATKTGASFAEIQSGAA